MTMLREMYDEWVADLKSKGFGGLVEQFNNHKNDLHTIPTNGTQRYTASECPVKSHDGTFDQLRVA